MSDSLIAGDLHAADLARLGHTSSAAAKRNGCQRIDVVEQKDPHSGDITGDVGDALEQPEPRPLAAGCNLLSNECTRDIHGEPCLRDSRIGPLLGQQVEILDAAVQYVDGMKHPQATDIRDVHLHRAAGKILGREAGHAFVSPPRDASAYLPVRPG